MYREAEKIILDCLKDKAFLPVKPPQDKLKYYFVEPGIAYSKTLWDWDSYWYVFSLLDICELFKEDPAFDYSEKKKLLCMASKGDVLNFLDFQEEDGFVPIMLRADYENDTYAIRPNVMNTHKPFLCQAALLACRCNGDYHWLPVQKLIKYIEYYRKNQYDAQSGFFFWRDDVMIGGDNNPTVFGRPRNSSADVFLNCFMVSEYRALVKIMENLGLDPSRYRQEGEELASMIRSEMWDEFTGYFYTQDIQVKTYKTECFQHGLPAFWKTMPLKIKFWGCYLPLLCGIASSEQAERMARDFAGSPMNAAYGVRTLAEDEKMYNLAPSGNPSNWLGACWTIANYALFQGFLNYGFWEQAREIFAKTIRCLSEDIKSQGSMSESYHPDTGKPILHNMFFSWNCLAASMIRKMRDL